MSPYQIAKQVESGIVHSTPEVLRSLVVMMNSGPGPTDSLDDHLAFEAEVLALATGGWVRPLFQLLEEPPTGHLFFTPDGWDNTIHLMLASAAEHAPEMALQEALELAPDNTTRIRAGIIATIGGTGKKEGLEFLDMHIDDAPNLTELEASALVDALGTIGGQDSLARLHRFRTLLGPDKVQLFDLEYWFDFFIQKITMSDK